MTEVTEEFIYLFFYTKILEALKPLEEIRNALDPCEEELIERISGIIEEIIQTKF